MDLQKFFGFVQILKDSIKIITKNGRMMASITTLFFLTYTLFYILNIFSIKPLISDLVFKLMSLPSTNPSSPDYFSLILGIEKDDGLFLVVEIIYFILYLAASLVSLSALVIVWSTYYTGKIFSGKEIFFNAIKSLKRPFLTYFFIILMSIGDTVLFVLVIMVPILLLFPTYPIALKSILILLSIPALIIYIGFSVVWVLGIVISVIEEDCYGIQALGKAGKIIKGKMIDGFLLNLGWNLIFLVLYGVLRSIMGKAGVSTSGQIIMGLFVVIFVCLVQLLQFTAYTALYFECKKNHGEEIGNYSKIPTKDIDEDIP